ncbi:MAG: conjugal transfer protein TraN [Desulfuromonadaceae bacterium]|nr:conjugal transfer protein TraN [Desulfuromonadaceae bacterium]
MLFRITYSVLYAVLLLSLSGITTTAQAVVSCQDTISTGTTYRYIDALAFFTEFNGKTYAIAKSAASGSQSLPDIYFDFSANISREYLMTGTDTASLKRMLSLGQFGAAKPVSVGSQQTLDFLIKRYGAYLGTSTSDKSTYIDAWKEFGPVGFNAIDGSGLPFTNWPAAGAYAGQDPQAVVMGSDGIWASGLDGTRSSQIVEFPGKLDCAFSYVDSGTITPPPPPPPPLPPDPNAINNIMCGQDLNNNGYAGDPGETANCIQTTQGQFCPVGSTECVETYTAPVCPTGSTLETTRDMCQATAQNVCGSGYTWDAGIDKCIKAVVCPENGTFNPVADRCEKLVQSDCPLGYSYDGNPASPTFDRCVKSATCTDGGAFVAGRDRCEKALMPVCDAANGYAYNTQSSKCERIPVCSSGSYNTAYNLCMKPFNAFCSSGYTLNTTSGRCELSPQCSQGTFNPVTNKCESGSVTTYPAVCVQGTLNSVSGKCDIIVNAPIQLYVNRGASCYYDYNNPYCPDAGCTIYNDPDSGGAYCFDATNGWYCPNGLAYPNICSPVERGCHFGSNAWGMSFNSAGGSGTITNNACGDPDVGVIKNAYIHYRCGSNLYTTYSGENRSVSISCPSNDFLWIDGYYYTSSSGMTTCPAGTAAQVDYLGWATQCTYTGAISAQDNPSCPAGGTLQGTLCVNNTFVQVNPTCPSGSFDYGSHVCIAQVDKQCDIGFSLDTGTNLCVKSPSCPNGTLNTGTDLCEATITSDCGSYSFDAATNLCFSSPVCANGAYDAILNVCQAMVTRNCGSYSWSQADLKCLQPVTCPKDPAFSLAATTTFSSTLDKCVSEVQHDCPAGTTFTPLPIGKCEAVPICTGAGIYNAQKDSCFEGFNTCPLGAQYACMEYQGKMQCSPNPCFNPGAPGSEVTTTLDESMLQDDGPKDAKGNCLGQIYIFNGKASRCRPPGLTVGMINNCCESDKVASEDTGTSITTATQGIQMAYEIGQVAYYGNALVTGAAEISAISTTATGAVTSMTVVSAAGTTTTLSGAAATGAYATMASGATGASAIGAGMQAYAAALFNPATIVIAVVVLVVMKVLMGSGCDQGDIQTGMQNAAKDCHYVGDYCQRKWPLTGCVQKAKSFCCFNSKMARIIHEQGRPQLQAFQPNGDWGDPKQPNCRGFTPDEFQALDFSRIDLSEYFADVQKDLATKIDGSQQTIMQNIQNKYQAAPK